MRKILYLVTEDWFFLSHFLPMARLAQSSGFQVVVATNVNDKAADIAAEGFRLIPLSSRRGSLHLGESFRELARTISTVRDEDPDIVHCIAMRPVVFGGIAAKIARAKGLVLAPTGLGRLWMDVGPRAAATRSVIRFLVGSWFRGPKTHYLFENEDDPHEFGFDLRAPDVTIVGGAGVDPKAFPLTQERPGSPIRVAVVARMIWPKGIAEAVEAVALARSRDVPVELHLFGDPDPSNKDLIPETSLRAWSLQPGIHWHGWTPDVARVWRESHVALLLTNYREGLPRSLIEAAASGRPIVTTQAAGCRELVRDGTEGFLVRPGDIEAAAGALASLASDASLRARMGAAAHAQFQERFTEYAVTSKVAQVYRSLVSAQ